MIEDGVDPRNLLLFTFTKKAAEEIRERAARIIGDRAKDITISTYHSFCARMLRKYIHVLGIWDNNFTIYDDEDQNALIKEIVEKYDIDIDDKKFFKACQHKISSWKENMLNPAAAKAASYGESSQLASDATIIYEYYEEELRKRNALDFDDLICKMLLVLRRFPDVKAQINRRYTYITADESQDSSPLDLELIEHLGGDKMNICLIGDDYQAIYGFRGSNLGAFFDFVDKHHLKKFYLDRNYRSTQTIVDAAQSVVDNNKGQFEKHLFSKNEKGIPITLYVTEDQKEEAMRVTQIIKVLSKRGIPLNDIAVLYRMNYLSRRVEDSLINNAIPYRMLSGTPFYTRKEIKDVIAPFRFIINPMDSAGLERALTRPKMGLGEKSIDKIMSCIYDNTDGIMDLDEALNRLSSCQLKGKRKQSLEKFIDIIRHIDKYRNSHSVHDTIFESIQVRDYFSFLEDEDEESYPDRKCNVEELLNAAHDASDLTDFVVNLSVDKTEDEENDGADKVNLMTIHGSKGLEFRAVIVIGCNQGLIPAARSIKEGTVEEERRLFYVAMTRSKEFLFLTRYKKAFTYNEIRQQAPSCFLREIESAYIRKA